MKLLYVVECIEPRCEELQMLDPLLHDGNSFEREAQAREYFEMDLGWTPLENDEWYCAACSAGHDFARKEAA